MLTEVSPGALIGRRYRLDALLGEGGMGAVWAATHTVTRQRVALKMLKNRPSLRQDHRRRFWREARAASAVQHPNVVRIHDLFEIEDETLVMVMDLLTGQTLGQLLRAKGQLPLEEIASYLVPAVSAVGTAHALGIVHRDLKPDNIFLVDSGGSVEVRVLDFGIAKLSGAEEGVAMADTITNTGAMLGTPYYMSPEQGMGERDVDHRTDIWSFGVILFEALAGARPVEGENLGQVIKRLMSEAILPLDAVVLDLPREITTLVGRMLSRSRATRPHLTEVQAVLERHTKARAPTFGLPSSESLPSAEESLPIRVERTSVPPSPGPETAEPTSSSVLRGRRSSRFVLWSAVLAAAGIAGWSSLTGRQRGHETPVAAARPPAEPELARGPLAESTRASARVVASGSVPIPSAASAAPSLTKPAQLTRRQRKVGVRQPPPAKTSHEEPANEAASRAKAPIADGLVDDPPF
jgi:eukaryotic-like serine/threonine-protein kinase